jgi:hypothetical protein
VDALQPPPFDAAELQFQIQGEQRWFIYRRLQELGVSCSCAAYQPLQLPLDYPHDLLHLWSITRQYHLSRAELAQWLELCWQL